VGVGSVAELRGLLGEMREEVRRVRVVHSDGEHVDVVESHVVRLALGGPEPLIQQPAAVERLRLRILPRAAPRLGARQLLDDVYSGRYLLLLQIRVHVPNKYREVFRSSSIWYNDSQPRDGAGFL